MELDSLKPHQREPFNARVLVRCLRSNRLSRLGEAGTGVCTSAGPEANLRNRDSRTLLQNIRCVNIAFLDSH